jgi:hypothetical protein
MPFFHLPTPELSMKALTFTETPCIRPLQGRHGSRGRLVWWLRLRRRTDVGHAHVLVVFGEVFEDERFADMPGQCGIAAHRFLDLAVGDATSARR